MSAFLSSAGAASWRRDLLFLILGFGLLFGFHLGGRPLANPDEGRYGEIPREMLVSGDWVTPRLNDVPYFEKPPLVYWSVAACMAVFGRGEAAVRLTGALFALGGVLLTYAAGRRLFGRAAGMVAAVVLGSSLLYFALSQVLLLDMAVAVLISATLFCFILALEEPAGPRRRQLFYGLYVAAALATLTKGLIGFLLPGAVMFLWLLAFNQWHRLRPLYLPSGLLVFLTVAAPWHLLAAQRNPGWASFYFVHEHWERFTTTQHGRHQPWWFFGPILLLGLFPWTGFLWSALRGLPRPRWRLDAAAARPWFLVVWAAFIFLFFSKSQSKLIPYILPVLPALALLIGEWFSRHMEVSADPRLRAGLWTFAGLCGLLGLALPTAVLVPRILNDPAQAAALRPHGIVMGLILITGGLGVAWVMRRRRLGAAFGAMAMVVVAFLFVLSLAGGKIQRAGTRGLAGVVRAEAKPEDRIYHFRGFFHDFVFYTERFVGLIDYIDELEVQFLDEAERARRFISTAELRRQWHAEARVWVVVRQRDDGALRALVGEASYHLLGASDGFYLVSNRR
jgi:4-amino-4-deoxy-L-arabinose transferase-like glycosyltransferase